MLVEKCTQKCCVPGYKHCFSEVKENFTLCNAKSNDFKPIFIICSVFFKLYIFFTFQSKLLCSCSSSSFQI